jgi:hypothetical protein
VLIEFWLCLPTWAVGLHFRVPSAVSESEFVITVYSDEKKNAHLRTESLNFECMKLWTAANL